MTRTDSELAQDFKNRMLNHIITMKTEYEKQVAKWRPYFDLMADAQAAAVESWKATVTANEEAQQRGVKLAVMALGMAGGAAFTWLGGIVKNALVGKFSSSPVWKDYWQDGGYEILKIAPSNVAKIEVQAGYFSSGLTMGASAGLGKLVDAMAPKQSPVTAPRPATEALQNKIAVGDYQSFKGAITAALEEEIQIALTAFGTLHGNINNNSRFGDDFLAVLKKLYPKLNNAELEGIGYELIYTHVDTMRYEFQKNWFYYGNNPDISQLRNLPQKIEVQLWALWFLDQEYHLLPNSNAGQFVGRDRPPAIGNDGIVIGRPVLERLADDLAQISLQETWQGLLTPNFVEDYFAPPVVDTQKELDALTKWAKNVVARKGKYGAPSYQKRARGTIRVPASLFN